MTRRHRKSDSTRAQDETQPERASNAVVRNRLWKWGLPVLAVLGTLFFLKVSERPPVIQQSTEVRQQQSPADVYRSMIQRDPLNHKAHYNLGLSMQSQGQLDAAISHYELAISIYDTDPRYHTNLAVALSVHRDFSKAIEHFNIALDLEPDNIEARFNLGNALFATEKTEEAMINYRAVLEKNPEHSKAHNNLAVALKKTGQLKEAYKHRYEAMRLEREQKKP